MDEIEISRIDRRYENLRLKDTNTEQALLSSIIGIGIVEPLQCVVKTTPPVFLLDGFKRLRCAIKMGLATVPVSSLGNDENQALIKLLRVSNARGLNILEEAACINELAQTRGYINIVELAHCLDRSPAWVSVRLRLFDNMSAEVKAAVFSGLFPVRAYMYALLPFTRVKGQSPEIDRFVRAVSGKGLSSRGIGLLAQCFFKGKPELKEQILSGNLAWTIEQLSPRAEGLGEVELKILKCLEWVEKYFRRLPYDLARPELKSQVFLVQASDKVKTILSRKDYFIKSLEEFYADRRPEKGDKSSL